jgi:Xaa-Pro dipeptidase
MLLNRDRAIEIMQREKLDGLIAQLPINLYYLSGYWGLFNTPIGYDGSYFAVLPRDTSAPASLVVPALEIRRIETMGGTWMENLFAYSGPADDIADSELFADDTPRGVDYSGWPVVPDGAFSDLEKRWLKITQRLGAQMSATAIWALIRGLKAAGLENARLGVDDHRLGSWLGNCGFGACTVNYCPELFNEIRLVKTEAEIDLLRSAAGINEIALLTTIDAMYVGATWGELENEYMMTMASQGGRGVYLMCGVGELPYGEIRRGEPVLFDALGQYQHYHGDFGRCGVVGEPTDKHLQRHRCLLAGWDAAQEMLKPGVRYSELSTAVGQAVRSAGIAEFRDPIVHSVGLEHTDDPKPFGVQPQSKPDQILQTNMVVNVDMPHSEIGWGSVHMEDTVRITADGFERMGNADFSLRVV